MCDAGRGVGTNQEQDIACGGNGYFSSWLQLKEFVCKGHDIVLNVCTGSSSPAKNSPVWHTSHFHFKIKNSFRYDKSQGRHLSCILTWSEILYCWYLLLTVSFIQLSTSWLFSPLSDYLLWSVPSAIWVSVPWALRINHISLLHWKGSGDTVENVYCSSTATETEFAAATWSVAPNKKKLV